MIKKLNTKLLAGIVAAGIVVTLSGTKTGVVGQEELESASYSIESVETEKLAENMINIEEKIEYDMVPEDETEYEVVTEEESEFIPVVMATTDVNIRSINNTDGEIYDVLSEGSSLPYTRRLNNGWYEVIYQDKIGYISGDYLVETVIVDKDSLFNVYMNSNTDLYDKNNNIIGELPYLEFAKVYEDTGDKYFVQCEDKIGYISKEYATILDGDYVVVDISRQNLTLYHDNEEMLSTSVVTGKDSTPSDIGLFDIDYMSTDTVLRGDNYASPVSYWMPYNGGEGLHDATWRYSFGGDIYHYDGSHGCINMPLDMAAEAYSQLDVGDKVLVKE